MGWRTRMDGQDSEHGRGDCSGCRSDDSREDGSSRLLQIRLYCRYHLQLSVVSEYRLYVDAVQKLCQTHGGAPIKLA